jgi:hypothetical protein
MKQGGMSGGQTIMIVVALAIAGMLAFVIFGTDQPASQTTTTVLTEGGPQGVVAKVSCPSDQTTDGQLRYEDTLASTTTYDASPTCYFMPDSADQERATAGALSASAFSTAVDLPCTASGTKWHIVCTSTADDMASVDEGTQWVAEGSAVKRSVEGKAFRDLQIKVEDKVTGGAKYLNVTGGTTDGEGWRVLNGSNLNVQNGVSTGTSLTLATDGYIDVRIYMKTNETKAQFGEDGLRTWMLVDADGSEYQEPVVARNNGATLVNQLSSMQSEDLRKYSGYEYAYNIGSIGDRENFIDYYQESASGVNPSTDPIIEFCAEGRYASSKQTDTILIGCWTDAATQTEVVTSYRQYFNLDIA